MRNASDDVRNARLRRGTLLTLTATGLASLALGAPLERIRPWVGPPAPALLVVAALATAAAAASVLTGRRAPEFGASDGASWLAALLALGLLAGAASAPLSLPAVLYLFVLVALAARDPGDGLVVAACATTATAPLVRLAAGPTAAAAPTVLFAIAAMGAFTAVVAQTRRLARALVERDQAAADAARLARSVAVAPPAEKRATPVRAVSISGDDFRTITSTSSASDTSSEQTWDSLVERLRASVSVMAESAGVALSVEAELSGLAPPSSKIRSQLLRIAQEATTQALRHAEPRSITVMLRRADGGVVFELHDDGTAGEATRQKRSLATLKGRAAALGGTAELKRADRGWVTRIRLPCEQLN